MVQLSLKFATIATNKLSLYVISLRCGYSSCITIAKSSVCSTESQLQSWIRSRQLRRIAGSIETVFQQNYNDHFAIAMQSQCHLCDEVLRRVSRTSLLMYKAQSCTISPRQTTVWVLMLKLIATLFYKTLFDCVFSFSKNISRSLIEAVEYLKFCLKKYYVMICIKIFF